MSKTRRDVGERTGVDSATWWDERAQGYDWLKWVHNPNLLRWCSSVLRGVATRLHAESNKRPDTVEVGCGTGALTEYLATMLLRDGCLGSLIAYDVSPAMLKRCRERLWWGSTAQLPVQLIEGDDLIPPDEAKTADLIVSRMVLHHAPDGLKSAIRRWVGRLNRPGAVVVCEGPPVVSDPGHPAWRLYQLAMEIKEPGRLIFSAAEVAEAMFAAGCSEVVIHERFSEGNSLRGWLDNGSAGLKPHQRAEIERMHWEGHDSARCREAYQMEKTDDGDLLMRWRHCVVVGFVRGER